MTTENGQLLEEQVRLREKEDRKFMRQALTQAKKAAAIDQDVPARLLRHTSGMAQASRTSYIPPDANHLASSMLFS